MKKTLTPMLPGALWLSLLLAFVFSNACNTPAATGGGLSADTLALADLKMKAYVEEGKLPCVSTLVIRDGKTVHRGTFGYENIEEGRALKENTIFRIYSMSKPVTAAALMILYDEGKFRLDDPVAAYIPEFENTKVYQEGELVNQVKPFTIRQLLTHTAGFCYGWEPNSYVDSLYNASPSEGMWNQSNIQDMVRLLAELPLKHQPGTVWEYSVSIDVAGYLVEVLSGVPFDEFLQTRIFGPLGMEDTGFEVPEEDFNRLAMVYTPDQETGKLRPVTSMTNGVKKKVTLFSGGGGLVSTLDDYGKFGQMLLNGGILNGERVLQETTVKLIMSDHLPPGVIFRKGMGYGLGGMVAMEDDAAPGIPATGYSWTGAASTYFVADPVHHMVILAFTQYTPHMGVPFAYEFGELVQHAVGE
jgi:CubicO group peptidase (beta-lactamase class C family)